MRYKFMQITRSAKKQIQMTASSAYPDDKPADVWPSGHFPTA